MAETKPVLLELVSKELNHLAAILHVYAGGVDFYEVEKNINFQKEKGNTFTLLIIFIVKSLQKSKIQGIPAFRDFTIRDPRYFVILFHAFFHDFEEKKYYYFSKRKGKYFHTFNHFYSEKSSKKEQNSTMTPNLPE